MELRLQIDVPLSYIKNLTMNWTENKNVSVIHLK